MNLDSLIEAAKAKGVDVQVHIHVNADNTKATSSPRQGAAKGASGKGSYSGPKRPFWEYNGRMYARPDGKLTAEKLLSLGFTEGENKKGEVQFKIVDYDGLYDELLDIWQ